MLHFHTIQHRTAGNPEPATRVQDNMTDTPKKTLTISRKPTSGGAGTSAPGQVTRSGKRIIRREELATNNRSPKPAQA